MNSRILVLLIIGAFLAGCSTTVKKKDNREQFIAAYVPPFYYFKGPRINVGKFSEGLRSDSPKLLNVIEAMESDRATLMPEQMYVAAIRLYESGNNDLSLVWFYRAFYKGQFYGVILDDMSHGNDFGLALKKAYIDFHQQVGPFINGFAGCDPDSWISVIEKVVNENTRTPDIAMVYGKNIKFIPKEKWAEANREVAVGMNKLIQGIESLKPSWKEMRDSNGLNERYCQ